MWIDERDRRLLVTVPSVGRLENIIARNRQAHRPSERLVSSVLIGCIVLLILALAVFTDLGRPPDSGAARPRSTTPSTAPSAAPATPGQRGKSIDGVLLRRTH
jgi:hypothetical protein